MKKHFSNIDVLKGICIMIVIFEHAKWPYDTWKRILMPFWDRFAIPCFMVISGYVFSHSYSSCKSLKDYYFNRRFIKKVLRYLIPFTIAFLIELLAFFILNNTSILDSLNITIKTNLSTFLTIPQIIKGYLTGGYGPGNYYTPVIIQLVIIFPFLYLLIKKLEFKGLIVSFLLCLASEWWQYYFAIPNSIYRLLIFRHIFTICFGIYIYLGYWKRNKLLNLISIIIGLIYITAHAYYDFTPIFFSPNWAGVNFIAALFFAPIAGTLVLNKKIRCKPLENIGKASYHIYLTQMVYYYFVKYSYVSSFVPNQILYFIISEITCVIFGYVLYLLCDKFIKMIILL